MMYNCDCPVCGHQNKNLYMEETNGWMECERCGSAVQMIEFAKFRKAPLIDAQNLSLLASMEVVPCI